jgi:hypothetical protein
MPKTTLVFVFLRAPSVFSVPPWLLFRGDHKASGYFFIAYTPRSVALNRLSLISV